MIIIIRGHGLLIRPKQSVSCTRGHITATIIPTVWPYMYIATLNACTEQRGTAVYCRCERTGKRSKVGASARAFVQRREHIGANVR